MQAVRSFLPEFDDIRLNAVTAPSNRARWARVIGKRFGQLGHLLFEHRSTRNDPALVACDRATTRTRRPRFPVGIRQRGFDHLHCSCHPNLSMHGLEPMEEGSGNRIRHQLLTLAALVVGVKDETSAINTSEQHHSRGRATLGRRCGHGHRLGHGFSRFSRNLEPRGQLCHRVWVNGCLFHRYSLLVPNVGWVGLGAETSLAGSLVGSGVSGPSMQPNSGLPYKPDWNPEELACHPLGPLASGPRRSSVAGL